MNKIAFLTGISGQDGSHMAELLLDKGYEVHGLMRRLSTTNPWRIQHILDDITIHEGDLTDQGSLTRAFKETHPDEIYNFGSQSFVYASWYQPVLTANVTAIGALNVFEAARMVAEDAKIYQASSSEMFGKVTESPQNEDTRFHPRSPYGVAKVFAHNSAVNYRESYEMHISCGITFNHEGERRGLEFVTRKITTGIAKINEGISDHIKLGNLDPERDWGYSPDFCRAFYLMLQQETPDDYVIGTGETHSVREFVNAAFEAAGIENGTDHVREDPEFMRPAEVNHLRADYTKAKNKLGWEPRVKFKELVELMVKADIDRIENNVKLF